MKRISALAVCFMIFSSLSAQDMIEKISLSICNCVDTIENMDSLQSKIDRCVPESMAVYFTSVDDYETGYLSDADTIKKTIDLVMRNLTYYCPKIKEFILSDKEEQFYKMSDSETANELYTDASKALQSKDYKAAEKNFIKAIKASPSWILPLDDLGLTYRMMGDYKKAIKYYSKSLELYPEGPYALQNQAVAFTFVKDFESALRNYSLLIDLYPGNPEGYFGKGKTYFLMEDYENALDYIFHCHKLYSGQKSDYVKDTESLVVAIHNKMKEQNKLDIFFKKAEDHGITINN